MIGWIDGPSNNPLDVNMHRVPVGDALTHDTTGADCLCGPTVRAQFTNERPNGNGRHGGWTVVHHYLDGREADE